MSSIFLSHSSKDNSIAKQVAARLEQWGHQSIFLDFDPENGIPAGRDWEKELYAKLRECRGVIVLCSHASMASRWCFVEIAYAKSLGKEVFPIKVDDCEVDPILTAKQIIDATAEWDTAYKRLEKGLLAAGLDPKDFFDWDGRRLPYPGLLAFQEQDAAIFFGRDKEIRDGQALLNRLQQFGGPRLTLMLGASGSGKSSLMRAGLLPRLKRDPRWIVLEPFRPRKIPIDQLATVLSQRFSQMKELGKGTPTDVASVRSRIRWEQPNSKQSVDTFLELIKELREKAEAPDATVLLMIDQCEEFLTVGANDEGNRFVEFLRTALDRDDSRLMVLATLRSDFLGSFQDHQAMRGLRVEPFPVPQMQVDDFASVIEGPAKLAGLDLGPGLVQAMINDTKTTDALPLLAFTLSELYEGFGKDKRLTLGDYCDKLGRLDGCIARAAETVLNAKLLTEQEDSDLRTAFLLMIRVVDNEQYAKQPVQWNNLPVSAHEVLERLVTARLLISSGDENGRMLEVAHEALFRAWPRLVEWLKDNSAFLVWQQRLNTFRKEWNASQRNKHRLLSGWTLDEAEEWVKQKPELLSSDERQFVEVSQSRRTKQRVIKRIGEVLVVCLFGVAILFWMLWQKGYNVDQAGLWIKSWVVSIHVLPEVVNIHVLPEMVPIPGGTFQMGDVEKLRDSWRNPVHPVTIKAFKLGKYEVTFKEYDRFAIDTGRRLPEDHGWGREHRPVINVSWDDAKAYAEWLSEKTGKHYRLPTESEWEYAARSGDKQEVWAGTSKEAELGRYAVFQGNSGHRTAKVGSKEQNSFGLHDASGNVDEWIEDCAHDTYQQAPTDGSAWLEADGSNCEERVIRGGAWLTKPVSLRVSGRYWYLHDYWVYYIGFRLAQDIEP